MGDSKPSDEAAFAMQLMQLWLWRLELIDGAAVEIFLELVRASDFSGASKDLIYMLALKATAGELED